MAMLTLRGGRRPLLPRKETSMTTNVEERVGTNGKRTESTPAPEPVTGQAPIEEAARGFISVAGVVRAEQLSITNALVGGVAGETVTFERGAVRGAIAGRELRLRQAGAGMIIAGGTTELQQAGAQAIISAGSIEMKQAGSGLALAQEIGVGEQGMVVFGITPHLEVHEGGRVLFGPAASLAVLGAVSALLTAIVVLVRRRRGITSAA